MAYGILRDRHLAEDATRQAFFDIWRSLRHLKDPLKFEGWSYRILVRACYAEARRKPSWVQPTTLTETYRISNDDGAWQGSFPSMSDGGDFGNASVVLIGEGDYEGLYAWTDVLDWNAISGVIFSAPPPEAPSPPSAD